MEESGASEAAPILTVPVRVAVAVAVAVVALGPGPVDAAGERSCKEEEEGVAPDLGAERTDAVSTAAPKTFEEKC